MLEAVLSHSTNSVSNQWREKGTPMTPDGIGNLVRRLGREKGIDVTAHSLRRLYATTVHKSGVDNDTLRRLMRHVHIQTTMSCYLDVDPEKMDHAIDYVEAQLAKKSKDLDETRNTMNSVRFPSEKPLFPLKIHFFPTDGFFL